MPNRLLELLCHKQDFGVVYERSQMDDRKVNIVEINNSTIADYLQANNVFVAPCEVGAVVYWANAKLERLLKGEVVSFSLQKDGLYAYCQYNEGLTYSHLVSDCFGKTIFLTKEEAAQVLKGGVLK